MNLNDIKEYVTTKDEKTFSKLLEQDHEVVKSVINKFGNDSDLFEYKDVEQYLKKLAPHHRYFLSSYNSRGNEVTSWNIYDRYNKGYLYIFNYKGIDFRGHALEDGTIYNIYHTFRIYEKDRFGSTNWHELKLCETLDDYYEAYVKDVKLSKRKYMTYYNKEIKAIKQEYKRILKYHNEEVDN